MGEICFEGRVAVVTGAGAGLGRSYALELGRRGAAVVVNDLGARADGLGTSPGAADAVAAEIVAAGGRAVANHDSVSTREGGQRIAGQALDAFGRIDILIGNAGILRTGRFDELSDADIDAVLDVHLKGSFYVAQPIFTIMKRQQYGRILLTGSSSGLFGHPWQGSYGAAKAGVVGLSNVVALEGKDHGILCNVIMPNARTRLFDEIDWQWAREVSEVGAVLAKITGSSGGADRLDPAWVTPLALHLVSEASTTTHGVFSACSGHYSRVFVGTAAGWTARDLPKPEDIATHWHDIVDPSGFSEPTSVYDEVLTVRDRIARLS